MPSPIRSLGREHKSAAAWRWKGSMFRSITVVSGFPSRPNRISRWSCQPTKSEQFRRAASRMRLIVIEAARTNRYGSRDATMILVAYRHGLRTSELCELTWDAIDFRAATIHISRKKNGQSTTHQISGPELRELGGCNG